jgi:hypothetical protein
MDKDEYRWYLVVDAKGNVDEAFNSLEGARNWKKNNGGHIVKVKETT